MISPINKSARQILAGLASVCFALCFAAAAYGQEKELKIEDLIVRHLEAIGSREARASAKNRVVSGPVKLVSRIGAVSDMNGEAAMASASPKLRYSMKFTAPFYPGEQLAFDGEHIVTGYLPNGKRSPLSLFFSQQSLPLKYGLLGGTLSTAWPMLRIEQQQPRLEYRGLKKIEGRQLHEVSYRPRKESSDLKVSLYFDPLTFRHVRSEYQYHIGARLGEGPNDSNRIQESYYLLTEDFDDFRAVDGLTLPHKYKLQLSVQSSLGSLLFDWTMNVEHLSHNEALDERIFQIK